MNTPGGPPHQESEAEIPRSMPPAPTLSEEAVIRLQLSRRHAFTMRELYVAGLTFASVTFPY